VKLVHLVGFIIKKFVTMHGHMNVKNNSLQSALNRHTVWPFTGVMVTDAAVIQFVLLKMSIVPIEICQGL